MFIHILSNGAVSENHNTTTHLHSLFLSIVSFPYEIFDDLYFFDDLGCPTACAMGIGFGGHELDSLLDQLGKKTFLG